MCYDRNTLELAHIANQDQSSPIVACHKVSDIANVAKLAYYTGKLFVLLGG